MILIENYFPCVLNMDNRVEEKMLELLLSYGYDKRDSNPEEQDKMVNNVQDMVNCKILRTHRHMSNWRINLTKEKIIPDQPITNNKTIKHSNGFDFWSLSVYLTTAE